jgi:hypothetical protein
MVNHPVIRLVRAGSADQDDPRPELLQRLGSGPFARAILKQQLRADTDPYLLLLLADQELIEGRYEQAKYLVEAAYEFFDRKASANIYRLCHSD